MKKKPPEKKPKKKSKKRVKKRKANDTFTMVGNVKDGWRCV